MPNTGTATSSAPRPSPWGERGRGTDPARVTDTPRHQSLVAPNPKSLHPASRIAPIGQEAPPPGFAPFVAQGDAGRQI